ncbi:MAG TPA: hypothetical protein VGI50_00620 [Solirubrobacteraceae bacterium]
MASSETPPEPGAEVEDHPGTPPPARRGPRPVLERGFLRLVATVGIVGIGVGVGAILGSSSTQGWIIGLVVAVLTIVLSWLLSSSRVLRRER